ncbi:MAG: tRNA (adenosine(37)-N6)-threonylcarbamoyltransferase complex dimerization subunit type 1 TsaB [Phycisphaerales bacterium]
MNDIDNTANMDRRPVTLAIETSSRIGSVALAIEDRLLEESAFSTPMQHSAEICPTIEGLLARHGHTTENIGQVHIAVGPGSFTGLRIAVAMAKAMHLAQGVRIVTVDSLDVVAANLSDASEETPAQSQPAPFPDRIAALYDAKRGQFYASIYDRVPAGVSTPRCVEQEAPGYEIPASNGAVWRKSHPDALMTALEIVDGFAGAAPLGLLGDGLLYHRDEFVQANTTVLPDRYWSPRAANVYRLGRQKASAGRFADPLGLTPFYLRAPQVTLKTRP